MLPSHVCFLSLIKSTVLQEGCSHFSVSGVYAYMPGKNTLSTLLHFSNPASHLHSMHAVTLKVNYSVNYLSQVSSDCKYKNISLFCPIYRLQNGCAFLTQAKVQTLLYSTAINNCIKHLGQHSVQSSERETIVNHFLKSNMAEQIENNRKEL